VNNKKKTLCFNVENGMIVPERERERERERDVGLSI
jgi:hypothetical protein